MFYVANPQGLPCTKRHEASGPALDEACRHYRPRLLVRKSARRKDWQEMKERGYRLVEEQSNG